MLIYRSHLNSTYVGHEGPFRYQLMIVILRHVDIISIPSRILVHAVIDIKGTIFFPFARFDLSERFQFSCQPRCHGEVGAVKLQSIIEESVAQCLTISKMIFIRFTVREFHMLRIWRDRRVHQSNHRHHWFPVYSAIRSKNYVLVVIS